MTTKVKARRSGHGGEKLVRKAEGGASVGGRKKSSPLPCPRSTKGEGGKLVTELPLDEHYKLTSDGESWTLREHYPSSKGKNGWRPVSFYCHLDHALRGYMEKTLMRSGARSAVEFREMVGEVKKTIERLLATPGTRGATGQEVTGPRGHRATGVLA